MRFFGTREQNLDRPVGKCLPEGFTHPLEANIRKLQAHGQPVRFDFSVGEGDSCGWFGASISVRHNAAGKYAGLTLVAWDITQRVLSEKELHFRQWVLEAVADSSNTLITYPDIEDAIRQSLKRTGEILGFARISVFKNFYDKESRHYYFDQIIRWNRNENAASPPNPELQRVFWLPGLAPWYEKLKSGNIMVTHDAQAIEGGPEIIRKLGIRSLIMVPIHINFFFWGFIGFDGQRPEREFSEFDRHILKTISGTIGGAIDRFDKEQSLMDTEEILSRNIAQLEQSQHDLEQATSLLIQNEKLATLGTIAGSVAHEINSPLGAILNCAERLSESNLSEDQRRQNVKLILNAATRCKYVVEKLLMTSRRSPDQNFCSLNQVINDWFELYGRQLVLLDIAAEVKVPPSVHVKIGYNECSQVLTNVLMNARDALAENPAENRKIILKTTLQGNFALIRISNNGPQIPPGHLEKLFQVFFTSKESGKGTGLGLWICRNILDKAGGSISLRNAAEGVECSIRIPTDPAAGKKDEMSLND